MLKEILDRKSPKFFLQNHVIQESQIYKLIDAARRAPSSFNEQPWRFIVAGFQTDEFNRVIESLNAKNQEWAKNCSLLIISGISYSRSEYSDRDIQHMELGLAVSFLLIQGESLGLQSRIIGGFNKPLLINKFVNVIDWEPVVVIGVGVRDDTRDISNLELQRKPIEEIAQFFLKPHENVI